MAIEIFISYRRSDAGGHARYLFHALRESFDAARIFFDLNTLEAGDDFPAEIETAVRECRVLLALIGPGWLDAGSAGQRRLDDPNDFVRREIAIALAEGKRVIPVLIDKAEVPTAARLPEVLAGLPVHDAHEQHGKTYEYDAHLAQLVRIIGAVPGVAPPRAAGARSAGAGVSAERDKLAFLCDRSAQDEAAGDTVRAQVGSDSRRPFVLVVHGRADEAHDAFVERLEGFSLPRLLKGSPLAQGLRFVRIYDPLPVDGTQASFDRRLREKLAEKLDTGPLDDDAALIATLRALKLAALVVVVTWRVSELAGEPLLPLQRVFDHWARLADLPSRSLLGCIVCIKYDQAAARGGFLKRLFASSDDRAARLRAAIDASVAGFAQDPRVAWCVAKELPSVTVADLDRWAAEVGRLVGRLGITEAGLHAIIGADARPMEAVLPELQRLVAAN